MTTRTAVEFCRKRRVPVFLQRGMGGAASRSDTGVLRCLDQAVERSAAPRVRQCAAFEQDDADAQGATVKLARPGGLRWRTGVGSRVG
jgi:hypothetical protein